MTKLYEKSEICFTIIWIVVYVVLSSGADRASESIGVIKSVTAVTHAAMCLVLFFWIRKNELFFKYGLCKARVPAKKFLFYFPLIVFASSAFWGGIGIKYGFPCTLFYVISMCCVGFIEEIIFRGFLFRAMEKDNLKSAIIVSSLTFGLGHIVNLVNGSGQDSISTMIQVILAIMVGLVLTLVFYYGGSLIPCILFHSVNNALRVFSISSTDNHKDIVISFMLLFVLLCGYLIYLVKTFRNKAKESLATDWSENISSQ